MKVNEKRASKCGVPDASYYIPLRDIFLSSVEQLVLLHAPLHQQPVASFADSYDRHDTLVVTIIMHVDLAILSIIYLAIRLFYVMKHCCQVNHIIFNIFMVICLTTDSRTFSILIPQIPEPLTKQLQPLIFAFITICVKSSLLINKLICRISIFRKIRRCIHPV